MLTGGTTPGHAAIAGQRQPLLSPPTRQTVTLITGDVVTVTDIGGGRQTFSVQRPAAAVGGVQTYTIGQDSYVIPDEAMPFVAAQSIDRRLFDVSALIRSGYDDQQTDGLALLVSYDVRTRSAPPAGIRTTRTLASIQGAAVTAPKNTTRDFWRSIAPVRPGPVAKAALGRGVQKIWLDGKVKATMAESNAQIGTAAAWSAGIDGRGVKVAVLDTGYDTQHPDLSGRVSASQSFVPGQTVDDVFGHGTHVLSTVGGSGAASNGLEKGVAPGADLIVGKVLGNDGFGQDSWIIAGMEWAAKSGARVISMSLGSLEPYDGTDVESLAVNRLTDETGALFVVAAGNQGCAACMGTPAAADQAITVGAVDNTDTLAWFSSQGPRYGDYGLKPDIVAPGVGIVAALKGGNDDIGYYTAMDGTSMATPHVAGVAALLAQQHPDWKAQQIKDALMSTAKELPDYRAYQVGAGRVSVPDAINATITATGSAYFGFHAWPQIDDAAVTRTITYTNSGDTAVTLQLAESASTAGGPYDLAPATTTGAPAPAGMFTLSADTVTVPARGTASVTATGDPASGAPGTRYLGQIVATGANPVRTQIGLYLEDQRYSLDITVKDRAGKPAGGYLTYQQLGTYDVQSVPVDPETGQAHLRLRAGTYQVLMFVDVQGSRGKDSTGVALLGAPELTLDHDQSLVLDARKAVPARADVGKPVDSRFRQMEWYRNALDVALDSSYLVPDSYDDLYVLPTKKPTIGDFEYNTRWRLAQPQLTVTDRGHALWTVNQVGSGFLTGPATLDAVYAGTTAKPNFSKVKDKVAVVAVNGEFDGTALTELAASKGAKLLLLAYTLGGKLRTYVGPAAGGLAAIPVASLPTTVAMPLLTRVRAGTVTLGLTGGKDTPWLYDLQDAHPDRVPGSLLYQPKPAQMAKIEMKFYGSTATDGGEFRWDYRPFRTSEFAFPQRQSMPGTRTDYVSTQAGTGWFEDVFTGPELGWESRGPGIVPYQAGQHVTRNWFGPVVAPRNGTGFWLSYRDNYSLQTNIQTWSDGGDGTAGNIDGDAGQLNFKTYCDGVLLDEQSMYASGYVNVEGQTDPCRLTLDLTASRNPALFRTSTSSRTVWKLTSGPATTPEGYRLPILQVDYAVDTDLAGNAKGGPQAIGVRAYHLDGVTGAGQVGAPKVDVSFNGGGSWQKATVAAGYGGWTVRFTAPGNGFVSLRVSASDNRGNSVTQTVIRAYGLN